MVCVCGRSSVLVSQYIEYARLSIRIYLAVINNELLKETIIIVTTYWYILEPISISQFLLLTVS